MLAGADVEKEKEKDGLVSKFGKTALTCGASIVAALRRQGAFVAAATAAILIRCRLVVKWWSACNNVHYMCVLNLLIFDLLFTIFIYRYYTIARECTIVKYDSYEVHHIIICERGTILSSSYILSPAGVSIILIIIGISHYSIYRY